MEELLNRCNGILKELDKNSETLAVDWEEQQLWLEVKGKQLAQSREARLSFINDREPSERQIAALGDVWARIVSNVTSNSSPIDDKANRIVELDEDTNGTEQKNDLLKIATFLARLIRNEVADNQDGQIIFFATVPAALRTLWYTTSFALEDDHHAKLLTRALVQMLSNMVTDNENLQKSLWNDHLHLGSINHFTNGKERAPSDLLCRLLDSRDVAIRTATQILLINMTLNSKERSHQIATKPTGADVLRSLLHDIDSTLEIDEKEEEEEDADRLRSDGDSGYGISLQPTSEVLMQRQARYEGLGVLYAFFKGLFKEGLFDKTYHNLQPIDFEGSQIDQSIVSSAQITLLKLFDATLHCRDDSNKYPCIQGDLQSLPKSFLFLAKWAETTMKTTLQQGSGAPVDNRLIEVHVALILILQCLLSLAMASETAKETEFGQVCEILVSQMRQNEFIIQLLNLMRTTSIFAPPISPFATVAGKKKEAPDGHVLSSTGRANKGTEFLGEGKRPKLDKLKRDLVGLLGVISFKRGKQDESIIREVQDLVREQGGLLDVLNLTQLDERNPYIRERAVFALRNLLQTNKASQDLIAELKPIDPNQQQER